MQDSLRKMSQFALIVMGGALIAVYVAFCLTLKTKFSIAFLGALILPCVAIMWGKRLQEFILVLIAVTIPLNYGKLLGAAPPYEYHVGGAAVEGLEIYLVDILLTGLLVLWYLRFTTKEVSPPAVFGLMDIVFLGFLMWACLSLINSGRPIVGFKEILRWIRYYLYFFYVANNLRSRHLLMVLILPLLLGVVFQSGLGVFQYFTASYFDAMGRGTGEIVDRFKDLDAEQFVFVDKTIFRASGTVGPFNVQAMYYALLLPFALAIMICVKERWVKIIGGLCFISGIVATVLTFSRGGYLNIAVSTTIVFFLAVRKGFLTTKGFITVVFCGLFLFGAIMASSPSATKNAFYRLTHIDRDYSVLPRTETLRAAVRMIKEYPLTGVGMNQFSDKGEQYIRKLPPLVIYEKMPVHNRFLLFAAEIGIPGMLLYASFIFMGFFAAVRGVRQTKDPFCVALCIGMVGALAGALLHMQFDIYDVYTITLIIFVLLGTTGAVLRWMRP